MSLRAQWPAVRAAVLPRPGRWSVLPGLRAATAAAVVLGGSAAVADLSVGGIAYLGVACAVSFVGTGGRRARIARVAAQAAGAAVGMTVGAAHWLPVAYRLEHVVDLVAAAPTAEVAAQLRTRRRTAAEASALLETVSGRLRS